MQLLKRKGYVLKSETIDSKNVQKTYPKSTLFKKFLAASIVVLFSTAGLATTATIPAQADDLKASGCPLDIDKNKWVEGLGGLNSKQWSATSGNDMPAQIWDSANKKYPTQEATIRDRWIDRIGFVAWYPAIKNDTNDRSILKSVPASYETGPSNTQGVYTSAWLRYMDDYLNRKSDSKIDNTGSDGEKIKKDALIRKRETTAVTIWPIDNIACQFYVGGGDFFSLSLPNLMLSMGTGINKIATFLYVSANSGSNITQAIGLQGSSNVNGMFTTDSGYESWTYSLGKTIEKALVGTPGKNNGLYNTLYLNFLLPIVFIGAIVVLINGIKRRAIQLVTGIVWMLVVISAGTLFLRAPMLIPQTIDAVVTTVTSGVNDAVIGTDANSNPGCSPSKDLIPVDSIRNAKMVECEIWYNTIMKSWSQGQLGYALGTDSKDALIMSGNSVDGTSYDYRSLLSNKIQVAGTSGLSYKQLGGWTAYMAENISSPAGANVPIAMSNLGVPNMFTKADYFTNGFMALFISLTIALFVSANAFLILSYQIIMLLLLLTSPLFFVIGVIPSKTGKGIVLRWVELVVGLAVKRLIIGVLMAVFIKMFIIVANESTIGIVYQIIIFGVLAYVGITQRGKILQMFTANISFGGDKSIKLGGKIESIGERAPSLVKGGAKVVGGWAAARTAASTKVGIASMSNKKFERKLSLQTPEEKRATLEQRQSKVDKKQLRKTMLNGGSIEDAKSRMLDRTRNIEQTGEIRKNFKDQLDIQRDMRDAAADSAGNISRMREEMDPEFKQANIERDWQAAIEQKEQAERQAAIDSAAAAEAAQVAEEERIKNTTGLRGLANQIKNDATGSKDKVVRDVTDAKDKVVRDVTDAKDKVVGGVKDAKDKTVKPIVDSVNAISQKGLDAIQSRKNGRQGKKNKD